MKVKFFEYTNRSLELMQEKINNFIFDKQVFGIKMTSAQDSIDIIYIVMVMYEDIE